MADDLFADDFVEDEEVVEDKGLAAGETFNSATTVSPTKGFKDHARAIPLFTHKVPTPPAADLNVDLSGASSMQSIEDILAEANKEKDSE